MRRRNLPERRHCEGGATMRPRVIRYTARRAEEEKPMTRNPRLDYKVCTACGGLVTAEEAHARTHELLARVLQGLPPSSAGAGPGTERERVSHALGDLLRRQGR